MTKQIVSGEELKRDAEAHVFSSYFFAPRGLE